ncbi:MAG: restriction endonuclease subunit S [Microthrixaceae bacterium]
MSGLPQGWEWSTVGEVASVEGGVTPKGMKELASGDVPFFKVGDMHLSDREQMHRSRTMLDRGALESARAKLWPRGTIVFPKNGGAVATNKKRRLGVAGACDLNMMGVLPTSEIDGSYLMAWFLTVDLADLSSGSVVPKINRADVAEMDVPVPPLPEQRRIVAAIEEHFSRLDAAEAALEAALRRLAALRQTTTTTLYSSDEWDWTTLGQIAEVRGGVTKDSKRQDDPDFVEVPFLRVANVQRGYLDLGEVKTIRVAPARAETLALEVGDVLFNEGGDRDKLGRGWVWDGQIDNCIHQNHVFRARLLTDDFDPKFISTHGNSWGKNWFERNGKQTTNLASINLTTLKQFPVPAAPKAEQRAIVEELRRLDDDIGRGERAVNVGRRRGAALRCSILAAAFSGQLVPQDLTDEPASALLERIAAERATGKPTRRNRATT